MRLLIFVLVLLAASLAAPALCAQTIPTFGAADKVVLSWDAVTTDSAGAPLTAAIANYEIAITDATADMNGTGTPSSVKLTVASTANIGTDITASLKTWGRSGKIKIWVRAFDGVNWSAWSTPIEALLIIVAPAPPKNLKVAKG